MISRIIHYLFPLPCWKNYMILARESNFCHFPYRNNAHLLHLTKVSSFPFFFFFSSRFFNSSNSVFLFWSFTNSSMTASNHCRMQFFCGVFELWATTVAQYLVTYKPFKNYLRAFRQPILLYNAINSSVTLLLAFFNELLLAWSAR